MDIYNPICYSLYADNVKDEECLKRCFWAYNYIDDTYINVYVCAEYFRLLYRKNINKKGVSNALDKTLFETIGEYIPLYKERSYLWKKNSSSLENLTIYLTLMEKPYKSVELSIIECFKLILENPNKCKELRTIVANNLIYWSESKTLKKDLKLHQLIKDAFQIEGSAKIKKNYPSQARYYLRHVSYNMPIDENSFIDLITYLFNKLN